MIIPKQGDYIKFTKPHLMLLNGLEIEVGCIGQVASVEWKEHGGAWSEEIECILYIGVKMQENPSSNKQVLRFLKLNYAASLDKIEFIPATKAAKILYDK